MSPLQSAVVLPGRQRPIQFYSIRKHNINGDNQYLGYDLGTRNGLEVKFWSSQPYFNRDNLYLVNDRGTRNCLEVNTSLDGGIRNSLVACNMKLPFETLDSYISVSFSHLSYSSVLPFVYDSWTTTWRSRFHRTRSIAPLVPVTVLRLQSLYFFYFFF